LIGSVHIFLE